MTILYTKLAKVYHEMYQDIFDYKKQYQFLHRILKKYKCKSVLEIGCGTGNLAPYFLKAGYDYTGMDLSRQMINIARKNVDATTLDRIKYEVGDAHDLLYPNNSFDFVISSSSLHHWRYRDQVIREIKRVLKNDCSAYIWDFRRDATNAEIRITIMSRSLYALYLSWALKFHGLSTKEWRSLDNRFSIRWNGALACLVLKKNG